MIGRDEIFDDLEVLEEKFEGAAKDTWMSLHVKHREMSMALHQMLLIVRREFIKNPAVGRHIADFVLDFLERGDMVPSALDQGFKDVASRERRALDMQVSDAVCFIKPKTNDLEVTWSFE